MRPSQSVDFVSWFRAAAPWIHAFRGRTFVVAFGGEIVEAGQVESLTQDVNLLTSLGIRVVIVSGSRPQINAALAARGLSTESRDGLRITHPRAMDCVKEAVGRLRIEFEQRFSFGLPNTPMAQSEGVRLMSGSLITAQPVGVIDGTDFQFTGKVRDVDAETIHHALANGDIVFLTTIGYSATGEAFNLAMEDVAASVAVALDAEKLIFLIDAPGLPPLPGAKTKRARAQAISRELSAAEAERLFKAAAQSPEISGMSADTLRALDAAVRASKEGVARTHLIPRALDGALLMELFSYDGVGSMISEARLEILRDATIDDVGGVLMLIEPLEADGTLVRRGREKLEAEIGQFTVLEHDGVIAGCAALYPFAREGLAEMACFVVAPAFRGRNYGEELLARMESKARQMRIKRLFVLTTRTAHWFIEHGFVEGSLDELPEGKQRLYNFQRQSKIFLKKL
ncbi:MAG: amino-acid N-acetyltransferase [Burkholderiales bacterium]|nr:amino-acid N-acetyltransferase [Burkholderiales bacterium]